MRTVDVLQQGKIPGLLGYGPSTIRSSGCLLTCLTMAVNSYRPEQKWSVEGMNEKLVKEKLFNEKSKFVVANAFKLFNIDIRRGPIIPMKVDEALNKKQLVIIGVDYKEGAGSSFSKADHFVLFFGTDMKGNYLAADPMTGSVMRFDKVTISKWVGKMHWRAVEMIILGGEK